MADLDMEKRDNLIVHIEGLQATLTKRNARIAELEDQLSGNEWMDERAQKAEERAYKRGWKACASHLMQATTDAANALGSVRRDAWKVYLEAERPVDLKPVTITIPEGDN